MFSHCSINNCLFLQKEIHGRYILLRHRPMAGVDKKVVLGPADSQLLTFTQYITGCSEFHAYLSVKSQYSAREFGSLPKCFVSFSFIDVKVNRFIIVFVIQNCVLFSYSLIFVNE